MLLNHNCLWTRARIRVSVVVFIEYWPVGLTRVNEFFMTGSQSFWMEDRGLFFIGLQFHWI